MSGGEPAQGGDKDVRPTARVDLSCGSGGDLVLGSIDELAVREAGAGADECDEVGCVHRASVPVLTR